MIYKFRALIYTEGGRAFVKIPFNVWEETGIKGNIPCRVSILDFSFECKLIPKGNGKYLIPITKIALSALEPEEYEIGMEAIEMLSRINHDSPYSKEHPIRKMTVLKQSPFKLDSVAIAALQCLPVCPFPMWSC